MSPIADQATPNGQALQLVECPRDAMQGWKAFIPTEKKIAYLNSLLQVGFDTIDFGSFVSPKAIPQMADTKDVVKKLRLHGSRSKLLAIVANRRGAEEAVAFDEITHLGFPFSISETFQQRNANSSVEESVHRVHEIQNLCAAHNKELVVYLSMGFGNPYGDAYNEEILLKWTDVMAQRGVTILSLADTVGMATPEQIRFALNALIPKYPTVRFGVHLHAAPDHWKAKVDAALAAGCTRIDGALKGIGGCPMAGNDLVGNLNTELLVEYLAAKGASLQLNEEAMQNSLRLATEIFA